MTDGLDAATADRVRMHVVQAFSRSRDPTVDRHLAAALAELDGEPVDDLLAQCPVCETVGLPEQLAAHDCKRR
jgi:hypothetical protein